MHRSHWLSLLSAVALFCAACGDDSSTGAVGDGGSADASNGGAGTSAGSGDSGTKSDAGGGSQTEDAAVGGGAGTDAGGGGEVTCDGIEGKTPTWKVIDPKLPDFEAVQDQTSADPSVKGFSGVAFGHGVFVALGSGSGQDVFRYATSTDGEKWTAHSEKLAKASTLYSISPIRFVNGKFIFFAEHLNDGFHVHTSSDGTTWQDAIVETGARALVSEIDASEDVTVYAGNNGDMRSSSDLKKWDSRADTAAGGFDFMDIAYGDGLWISTGNAASPGWFSKDGKSWTAFGDGVIGGGARIEYGNETWLSQLSGVSIKTSKDGKTFTTQTTTGLDTGYPARFTGGRFVTFSYAGLHPNNEFLASMDGVTWDKFGDFTPIEKRPSTTDASATTTIKDIQSGNCVYVAAGVVQYAPMPSLSEPYILTHKPLVVVGTFAK